MNEFESRIEAVDPSALLATSFEVMQLNLGLRCNQACAHCHQSSSPARTEAMPDAIVDAVIDRAARLRPGLVDVTGGAPELHPRCRALVSALRGAGLEVQVRTNLTVLLEPGHEDLPARWAADGVRVLASLPSWDPLVVERQRGAGTFAASLEALRRLNALGYGTTERLRLDLACNPVGAGLPGAARELEARFHRELEARHGVQFHALRVITNMPLGRLREALGEAGELRAYQGALAAAFNPATLPRLACRTTIVVAWDGALYDCDFNLGAGLQVRGDRRTVADLDEGLATRRIAFGPHCFACTARAGSS
jgi:radical SAM/Cys-rich protein